MQGVANSNVPVLPVVHLAQVVGTAAMFVVIGAVAGAVVMLVIRWRGWAWTCGMPVLVAAPFASVLGWRGEVCYDACAVATVGGGIWRHLVDLRAGGDLAELARDRVGPMTPIRRWRGWRRLRAGEWVTDDGVAIGFSRKGDLVRVPIAGVTIGHGAGRRGDRVGQDDLDAAAGAGRDQARLGRHLHRSQGGRLRARAAPRGCGASGRPVAAWEPLGDVVYNPFERGSNTEIADKLLAAEVFTEPHYQRLAQRYLGHVIRALQDGRRGCQPRDRRRPHARRTAVGPDAPDGSVRCPAAARIPRDAHATAGARSRRRPRPARDPRRVRRRTRARSGDGRSSDRSA